MRAGFEVVCGAALLAACSAEERPAAVAQSNAERTANVAGAADVPRTRGEPGRVLFVGTSLTAGLGLDPEEAYPALIAEKVDSAKLPFRVVNAGVSGETSAGALRRIDWLLREPVEVLVLETGANDGLRGIRVDSVRANIQAIIDRVRGAQPDARILLVQMEAPPNLGERYTTRFRAMFPELARANELTLVPFLLAGVAGEVELNQGDGIHPTAEGARVVAETVWTVLEPVLAAEAGVLDASPARE